MENPQPSLKKLNWKVNGRLFGFGTSPETDWKIIFILTTILAVFVVALSVFMFIKINRGEIFVVERSTEQEGVSLDTPLLRKTVLYYQNKAIEFERIKSTVTPATDPSL
ncbi:MAG: hypothetical protein Q8Q22_00015 [bacterium]|nr:hypothetical protein [bacterium]MDZ4206105.1 hypothetical protein [Patescibacteria group bacterium]